MAPSLSIARFERLLLRGDAEALHTAGLPDAAAVAAGHIDPFLPNQLSAVATSEPPLLPTDTLSVQIAHECAQCAATDVTLHSPKLASALTYNPDTYPHPLFSAYVAGVALLNAFIRDNWAGPLSNHTLPSSSRSDAAQLYLVIDGEDVVHPATSLYCLRAIRLIFVDSLSLFVQAGARLAPWYAARTLLVHQAVLSNPAPSLQNLIFRMFSSFLGPHAAHTRYLFIPTATVSSVTSVTSAEQHPLEVITENELIEQPEDSLLPTPVPDGANDIYDEEHSCQCALEETSGDASLMVLAYLELALAQKSFYDGDGALFSLRRASELSRVAVHVSGELGIRTKHQTKEMAQLVARTFLISHPTCEQRPDLCNDHLAFLYPIVFPDASSSTNSGTPPSSPARSLPLPHDVQVIDPDVFGYVKLSESQPSSTRAARSNNDVNDNVDDEDDVRQIVDEDELGDEIEFITPLEQTLALAHASVVRARNASHVLTKEEMAPYVDLVLRNRKSPLGTSSVVQTRALLHRVSFERNRGRYLERCMAQMEEISKFVNDTMDSSDAQARASSTAERNSLVLASSMPPRWELMKEVAISFGKIGLVKSAMEIFERLEYWDELVDCHRLIGNLGRAEALVRERLNRLDHAVLNDGVIGEQEHGFNPAAPTSNRAVQERAARRPRLLCVLGEVTRDRSHLETAWAESGGRYARAKRALARMCVDVENWREAVHHFRDAMKLNPLFPDAWFTYGCAAIQTGDMQLAANAFTAVIQQSPENGEAWNNLGRVLHDLGKRKEALKALTEAGKLKRDSWHIWNNVVLLATSLRSSLDIVRGMEHLLELRGKDGVVTEAIGVAVSEVERMVSSDDVEDKAMLGPVCRRLMKILGRCTSLVSTNPSIWAAYAKLHELAPGAEASQKAFDCRLKQVRSVIAHADWKSEVNAFRHMAMACDALVRVAIESLLESNMRAACLQVDSVLEQTLERFKDDEGFVRLTEARQKVGGDKAQSSMTE